MVLALKYISSNKTILKEVKQKCHQQAILSPETNAGQSEVSATGQIKV